jgi:hypothetical protein
MRKMLTAVTGLMICGAALAADGDGGRGAFRGEQKERRQAHYQQQHQENKALRQSIRGDEPCEQCGALASHRQTQFGENQTFRDEQYGRLVAFVTGRMQEKGVPAEKQSRLLAFIAERHDAVMDFLEGRCGKTVALLESLAADGGLTREEMRAAITERRQEAKSETQAFREQLKRSRPNRRQ